MRAEPCHGETDHMKSPTVLRCLIVDDNREFLQTATDVLRRGGIDVVGCVQDPEQAIHHATALKPDVVLVDIDLGGDDGFRLAEQLHQPGEQRTFHVILISTHSRQELAELIARSPAAGFIPKAALSATAVRAVLAEVADEPET